jgi:hypothetical protein
MSIIVVDAFHPNTESIAQAARLQRASSWRSQPRRFTDWVQTL